MLETTTATRRRVGISRLLFLFLLISAILALVALVSQQYAAFYDELPMDQLDVVATGASNGTTTTAGTTHLSFTPGFVKQGRLKEYVNLPPFLITPQDEAAVQQAIDRPAGEPQGLLYEAHPPGKDVVMGICAYQDTLGIFAQFVGTLRHTGYDGHIILGVYVHITNEEREYLESMDVSMYTIELVSCGSHGKGLCAKGYETLKLEWSRFEMCRQWLRACKDCTGWVLVMDTRDAIFQTKPFVSLPDPSKSPIELFFIEEIAFHSCPDPHSQNNWRWYNINNHFRYRPFTEVCYGDKHWIQYGDRPILCSGTTIGTRAGIDRFLSVMSDAFYQITSHKEERCRSPAEHDTDQWIMNYLYYQGKFGRIQQTRTIPWGAGPVNTMGHACVNRYLEPPHSQNDIVLLANTTRLILNNHESETSPSRIPAVLHQIDRCYKWFYSDYFPRHQQKFMKEFSPVLSWKKQ